MKVHIKKFQIDMDVKSNGIEFEIRKSDGSPQIGDCLLTMTGLTWCKGRKEKQSGIKISWEDFMEIMKSRKAKSAALKAAKGTRDI